MRRVRWRSATRPPRRSHHAICGPKDRSRGPLGPLGPPETSSLVVVVVPDWTTYGPRVRGRGDRRRSGRRVDNPAEPGDNLGETPDTPDVSLTACERLLTYPVDMTTKTPRLLRPHQVAALLGVGRSTVHDYEAAGRLTAERTPGGHRRYPADQAVIARALEAEQDRQ